MNHDGSGPPVVAGHNRNGDGLRSASLGDAHRSPGDLRSLGGSPNQEVSFYPRFSIVAHPKNNCRCSDIDRRTIPRIGNRTPLQGSSGPISALRIHPKCPPTLNVPQLPADLPALPWTNNVAIRVEGILWGVGGVVASDAQPGEEVDDGFAGECMDAVAYKILAQDWCDAPGLDYFPCAAESCELAQIQ